MTTEQKASGDGAGAGDTPDPRDTALSDMKTQIDNLNKGIASYRDEAKAANDRVKELAQKFEATAEKKLPPKNIELSEKDEEKFIAMAEKMGLVKDEDLKAERERFLADSVKNIETTAVNEFLEKHPEFDDDAKWKEVMDEFNLYKTPTNITGYRKLLERVYKSFGDSSVTEKARASARAEIINRSRLSMGGGSQGGADTGDAKAVEDMQRKYPSLSRDQIENRLAEIKSLYPTKK